MKPSTALKVLRAFLLFAFLLLAGFVIFCLALSAQAAPAHQKPPVVRIGQPYRAELKPKEQKPKEKPQAKPGELTITIHCHADCNLPGEDANAQYLAWRNSVQFGKLGRK